MSDIKEKLTMQHSYKRHEVDKICQEAVEYIEKLEAEKAKLLEYLVMQ